MKHNKANAKSASKGNSATSAQLATAAASGRNAKTTAQPGIIKSIMEQLVAAKQKKHPVTASQILASLKKQFPQRTETGMLITVRAQLSRLPKERDFAISKKRDGRVVTYAAA